jgi:hypothetical protein
MKKSRALTGKRAGEWIEATHPKLTYEMCRAWKLYCPRCYQPIHLRKSKKRKNYFAHYDFDDKTCPERSSASGSGSFGVSEAHEQELQEAESFIRQIFYGINSDYFQALLLEDKLDESPLVIKSFTWFLSNANADISRWVRYYCKNIGFLDWQNVALVG